MRKSTTKHNQVSSDESSSSSSDTKKMKSENMLQNMHSTGSNTDGHNFSKLCKENTTQRTDLKSLGKFYS